MIEEGIWLIYGVLKIVVVYESLLLDWLKLINVFF